MKFWSIAISLTGCPALAACADDESPEDNTPPPCPTGSVEKTAEQLEEEQASGEEVEAEQIDGEDIPLHCTVTAAAEQPDSGSSSGGSSDDTTRTDDDDEESSTTTTTTTTTTSTSSSSSGSSSDGGSSDGGSSDGGSSDGGGADTTAPPALSTFSANTGGHVGAVDLSLVYPDTSDYHEVVIRFYSGATAGDCSSGTVGKTITSFSDGTITLHTYDAGSVSSFRACIYDAASNLTNSNVAENVSIPEHSLFVTSDDFDADLTAGYGGESSFATGRAGANFRCQKLATDAGLSGTWRAVIATLDANMSDTLVIYGKVRSTEASSPEVLFNTASEMWDAGCSSSCVQTVQGIRFDESGTAHTMADVWSGSEAGGETNSSRTCENWSSNSSSLMGRTGRTASASTSWVSSSLPGCDDTDKRLYCIDQLPIDLPTVSAAYSSSDTAIKISLTYPSDTTLYGNVKIRRLAGDDPSDSDCTTDGTEVTTISSNLSGTQHYLDNPGPGRYSYRICVYDGASNLVGSSVAAYVKGGDYIEIMAHSSNMANGNFGGLAGADSSCQADADAQGLGGTWKAVLSDSSNNAKDRLTIGGAVYNLAGDKVADDATDLWDGSLDNGIGYTSKYDTSTFYFYWSGTESDGTAAADTCSDWGSTAGNGQVGDAGSDETGTSWLNSFDQGCTSSIRRLVCISQ